MATPGRRRPAARLGALLALLGAGGEARLQAPEKAEVRAHEATHEEQAPGSLSWTAAGDAKDVVGTDVFAHMSARAQLLFTLAAQMTEDNWLRQGGEGEQALKSKFVASRIIKAKVAARCPHSQEEGDCAWRQKDALLCELLQLVGDAGGLGDLQVLENAITAHAASTGDMGVDWTARAAMIARWKDPTGAPTSPGSTAFGAVKQRVLSGRYLERLVNRTCLDLARFRPDCAARARDGLFCEALAQASTVAVGTESGHKVILAKMEELLPRAQALSGRSSLRRRAMARRRAEESTAAVTAATAGHPSLDTLQKV